jgi:hypothetical protein
MENNKIWRRLLHLYTFENELSNLSIFNRLCIAIGKVPEGLKFAIYAFVFSAPFYVFGPYSSINSFMLNMFFSYWHSKLGSLWNLCSMGGTDQLSQASLSIWQPLFIVLPGWLLMSLFAWLTYFLSGYFMYRLLRFRFGLGQVGGYVGALFMLFNYVNVYPWTLTWTFLPLIIETFFWINERRHYKIAYVVAFVLGGLYATASPTYEQVFALFFAFMFMLICKRDVLWKVFLHTIVFSVGWTMIAWPTLIAMQEIVPSSVRGQDAGMLHISFFVSTVGTDGYRPYVQASLVIVALLITRFRHPKARMAFGLLVFFVLFNAAMITVIYFMGDIWSFAKGIGGTRLNLMTPFLYSFAAALAVDAIFQTKLETSRLYKRVCIIATVLFGFWILYTHILDRGWEWKTRGSYGYQVNAKIIDEFSKRTEYTTPFRIAILESEPGEIGYGVNTDGGAFHINGLETFTGFTFLANRRQVKYWDAMTRCKSRPGIMCYEDNQKPQRFKLKLPLLKQENSIDASVVNTAMLSVANVRYLISQYPIVNGDLIEIHRPGNPPLGKLSLMELVKVNFSGRDDLYLYELKNTIPRFYIARNVRVFDDDNELLSALSETTINEVRDTVFLSRTDGPVKSLTSNDIPAQASYIKLNNDEFEVDVSVEGPAYLVISNSFNEGWQCTNQDGKVSQMRPAFHLFTAIMVNEEDRTITCRYSPFASL